MPPFLLRLAYVCEFLLALIAIFVLWSQVGGQVHLDLMPWYYKLGLGVAWALMIVLGTAAAVARQRAWNAKTLVFLLLALILMVAMGLLSYYYHLQEDDDDDDSTQGVALVTGVPGKPVL